MYRWLVYSMFLNSGEHAASFLEPGESSSLYLGLILLPSFLVPGRFIIFHRHSRIDSRSQT